MALGGCAVQRVRVANFRAGVCRGLDALGLLGQLFDAEAAGGGYSVSALALGGVERGVGGLNQEEPSIESSG